MNAPTRHVEGIERTTRHVEIMQVPTREIARHGRIARRTDGGCIVAVVLEPPHESFAALRERVDAIEVPHERRHTRIVGRITEPAYVQLGDMACHGPYSAAASTGSL